MQDENRYVRLIFQNQKFSYVKRCFYHNIIIIDQENQRYFNVMFSFDTDSPHVFQWKFLWSK